ncbi:hypothetical protein [Flavobacterium crassostreae]|uniref:Phage tail tape measure protein n=1 Tax=Flavobacterium crassostreae TaxID=1763534 RepID=A0A1B9E7M8_9FLAO|nr:hypothetical protein [Flavobacterium crassostreae]OCB77949.1 hypothetical protein LPBF_03105 [Flavobacterium crassostreae]
MAKDGIITRRDIIEDQAMTIGSEYAKNMQPAIEANKQLVASLKEMAPLVNAFRKTDSQQAYIALKQQENLTTLKAINANKLLESSEAALEKKIKQNTVVWREQDQAEKALISTKRKNELATEGTNKALAKERVLLSETNKEIKLQARENLGLVGAYEKLNRARTEAQKRLADLLSAEVKNNAEIKIAQREYQILDVRVKAVDAATKNYSKNIGNYGSAFEGLNSTLKDLISTFGLLTGVALFGTIMKDIFSTIKDFDRQLIAVGKTTNISGEDLKQFGREVVDLGSDLDGISINGLLRSAEVAGTLGVKGTDNILKFSTAIEKLKLTSDIISDEQVQNFAKFIEVSSDSFENADRLASVITELGNNMATTEAQVLGNASEIQKGIAVYETSAQGVLGLGAATSALGSEAESSRSAIQSTFAILNKATSTGANLEKVLKLTGLTQKELSEQFNKDATGVFQKFVKGLSSAKDEGQNLSLVLEDLGITEKRAFTVVGSLAANYSVLENAMNLANAEYVNNIALNKEVEAASQSIASIIGDIKDEFEAYVLATNDANNGTEIITKTLKFFRDNLKDIISGFLKYGSVIVTFLAIQKLLNFLSLTYNAIKVAGVAAQISFTTATGLGTAAMKAQALAAQEATVAQEGLNIATKATPWGIILAALTAVVVAYMVFNDELSNNEKLLLIIKNQTKTLQDTEANYNKKNDEYTAKRFKQIEEEIKLRRAKGEDSKKLDEEEILLKKEVLQTNLDTYGNLKKQELDRTRNQIEQSEARIVQLTKENAVLAKSGYRVSKQGNTSEEISALIENEKEKLKVTKNALFQNSKITIQEQKRRQALLDDLDKDRAVKEAAFQNEENKKAIAVRQKRLKEAYDLEKKAQDDLFKLRQFRLQLAMEMDDEILKNDKTTLDNRLDALNEFEQLFSSKTKESAEFELQQLGVYNEKTGKLVRELSNNEIQILLDEGTIKKRLTSEQLLILEKYQNEQTKLKQKGVEERQKIIDSQVDLITKDSNSKIQGQDTELSKALEAENIKFKAITEGQKNIKDATEEHERQILAIKELYAKKGLQAQIDAIQTLLDHQDVLPESERISADKRAKIENDLAKYKLQLSEIGISDFTAMAEKRVELEKEAVETIKELSTALKDTLVDLTNTIFDARIQNIDNEISASNDYYDKQIELAGNDERQKVLLEKERAKKEKELQKEKKKEQIKQAVFNKALAIAEAGFNTAKAVTAALSAGPGIGLVLAVLTAGVAAAQLAAIIATPIPKYKDGRKGGPAEFAEVGDGGVSEIISRPDGSGARKTPNKPTLTFLEKDDVVHKSEAEYNKFMRQKILNGFFKEKELSNTFHIIGGYNDDSELINEMKLTREAIKKQKTTFNVINKIDLGYENYRNSNINWKN